MADETLLAIIPSQIVEGVVQTTVNRQVADMTELALQAVKLQAESAEAVAEAQRDMAKYQYAVPAEHRTKRSNQETIRHAITAVVSAGAIAIVCVNPAIGWPIAAIVGVLGGVSVVDKFIKKKKGDD